MKNFFFLLLSLFLITNSYSQTRLSIDEDFEKYGYNHETLALIPLNVKISLRPKQMKSLSKDDLEQMQENESYSFQQAFYSWCLKREDQDKLWVEVQDVNKTNALLKENGIEYKDIYEHTPQELAAILGVDAVAMGNYDTSKPMSEGASAALGLLIGVYGSTNKGTLNLFIYDGKEGHMAVNYFKTVAGSLFNSPDQLIDKVLRKASRRIPYTKPKN